MKFLIFEISNNSELFSIINSRVSKLHFSSIALSIQLEYIIAPLLTKNCTSSSKSYLVLRRFKLLTFTPNSKISLTNTNLI